MAIFRYEAADISGKVLRGAMEASTPQEVSQRLTARGFQQVNVMTPPGAGNDRFAGRTGIPAADFGDRRGGIVFGAVPTADLGNFFRQMTSLVHAGFTVGAALADLAPRTANRNLQSAVASIARATQNGASVAGQMAQFPGIFPAHVIGLVGAGETGGFVEFSLEECALWAEQDAALRQGMWLPKVLIWNAVWTVLFLLPLGGGIDAKKLGNGDVAHAFDGYAAAMPVVIGLGIALHIVCHIAGKMRHQPFAERAIDNLSLRIPTMAFLARMRALAAFTRVLRRLLMSGISPAPAFAAAADSVPNVILREKLRLGLPIVRGGQGLDDAIKATGLMAHDSLQMLITGQKTGQWIEMLDRVTAYYQDEAVRATEGAKAFQKRLGWLLTIIVNGLILCVMTKGCYDLQFKLVDQMGQ